MPKPESIPDKIKDDKNCPICNEKITDINKIELECMHIFCTICIEKWFKSKKSCPVCREESKLFPEIKADGVKYEELVYSEDDEYDLTDYSDDSFEDLYRQDPDVIDEDDGYTRYRHGRTGNYKQFHNIPRYLSVSEEERYVENLVLANGMTDQEFEELIDELNLNMGEY